MELKQGETVLTQVLTREDKDEIMAKEHDLEVIEMLCDCWLESLEEATISFQRLVRELSYMLERNISNNKITQQQAHLLLGQYVMRGHLYAKKNIEGNSSPSAFVKLIKGVKARLPNPVHDNKYASSSHTSDDKNVSIYRRHSARLAEYGVNISPATLKSWAEKKSQP